MADLLRVLDQGIAFLVPTTVWAMLIVGVFQLIRDSLPRPKATRRWTARLSRYR